MAHVILYNIKYKKYTHTYKSQYSLYIAFHSAIACLIEAALVIPGFSFLICVDTILIIYNQEFIFKYFEITPRFLKTPRDASASFFLSNTFRFFLIFLFYLIYSTIIISQW